MAVKSEDVARRAGVSRATVSQILNGRGDRFSDATRERVTRAARELQYQPSAAGRALALGSSDVVIALVPNTTFGGNLQSLFEDATEVLAQQGLTLVLRLATASPVSLERIVTGMRPRAVLSLQPLTPTERTVLSAAGVPGFDPSLGGDLNGAIGRLQAEHLIAQGYRRLAFAHLRDTRGDPFGDSRERGVRDVCRSHGLDDPEVLAVPMDLVGACGALDHLADRSQRYGIACYNDDVAIALLMATAERDLRVPDDIGLVGMDNTPLAAVMRPRLTTVTYDLTAVARNTVATTLAALTGDAPADLADLRLTLVPGGSA